MAVRVLSRGRWMNCAGRGAFTGAVFGLLLLLFAQAQPARAEVHAILVGVSDYWNLGEDLRLRGPRNDVRELARWLVESGVAAANVHILADGIEDVPAGAPAPVDPTKAAIVDAFERVTAAVGPNDLVVFYFSGHGSQQADLSGDETGPYDEIFLPIDTGRWTGAIGMVENALVDDELDFLITRLRNKGADVWGIIDACHAGTGFRGGAGDQYRMRQIAPEILGVTDRAEPDGRVADGDIPGLTRLDLVPDAGRATFFYAAQSSQRAMERAFAGDDRGSWYGLFTFHLLQRLRTAPRASYRQVFQATVDDIRGSGINAAQTPDFEGDMLDEPLLRGQAAANRHWRVDDGMLMAGYLDGVTERSIVALFADPTSDDDAALGYAQLVTVEALHSTMRPIHYPCTKRDEDGACPKLEGGGFSGEARFARVLEPALDFQVSIGRPERIDPGDGFDYTGILEAIDAIENMPASETGRLVLNSANPDVSLALTDGVLAVSGPSGVVDQYGPNTSLRLHLSGERDEAARQLLGALRNISRVIALYRVASAQKSPLLSLGAMAKPVETTLRVAHAERRPDSSGAACPSPGSLAAVAGRAVSVSPATSLRHCDIVLIRVRNRSTTAHDVTVLYVDGAYGIEPLWPRRGLGNRLSFNEEVEIPIRIVTRNDEGRFVPTGEERIVVLSVPVTDDTRERVVLTGLAQPGVTLRTGSSSPLEMFMAAAMADTARTRGGLSRSVQSLLADINSIVVVPDEN